MTNHLVLAIRVAFNWSRKYVLSLLSSFSSIKLILSVDDFSRPEYILVFGFIILACQPRKTVTVQMQIFIS